MCQRIGAPGRWCADAPACRARQRAGALACLTVRRAVSCHLAPRLKVFVSDCDGTLWGGAVADEGAAGVAFGAAHLALQWALAELQRALARGAERHEVQTEPHLVLLGRSFYQEKMLPPLAKWTAAWLRRSGIVGLDMGGVAAYLLSQERVEPANTITILLLLPPNMS